MRIALVTPEYVSESNREGGLANYIHRLSLSLAQMGHEPIVIVGSDRDEVEHLAGHEVHHVRFGLNRPLKMASAATLFQLRRLIYMIWRSWQLRQILVKIHQENPIDIVQYSQLGAVGLLPVKKIPSVTRLSSFIPLWREKGEYDHDSVIQVWLQHLLEWAALKQSQRVFGPARYIADQVADSLNKPVEVIETPFVMDTVDWDCSILYRRLSPKNYLLFFGRLNITKGILTIAGTLQGLFSKYPDIHFVFIGNQTNYGGRPIMDWVYQRSGQFASRVHYFPALNHRQLYPIVAKARAVVLPSLIDNFPNTCLEAMAHRQIVIGTYGTSFEQIIDDDKSGILCVPDNADALYVAIERALQLSPTKRAEMGRAARERIVRLEPQYIVPKLISFYEETIYEHNQKNLSRPGSIRHG